MKTSNVKLLLLATVVLTAALLSGCSRRSKLNEDNPLFVRGMKLQEEGRYKGAVDAYEQCLRHSPDSHKAHLQLAMIYEDHLGILPQAIVHYQAFLDASIDPDMNAVTRQWLTRAERKYFNQLQVVYGDPLAPPSEKSTSAPAETTVPEVVTAEPPKTDAKVHEISAIANASPPPAPAAAAEPTPEKPARAETFYVVQPGDSLSQIARKQLGQSHQWPLIFEANRDVLESPERLSVGMKLRIPHL